ncbi:MAG: DUF1579 domain-containing protein [Vicinamibacteria bacterium]
MTKPTLKSVSKPRAAVLTAAFLASLVPASIAFTQARPNPAALIAAQQTAMQPLAFMDGVWRGQASTTLPDGSTHKVTQTERIGPLLDGSIKVIEGRGYNADGSTGFNAFAVLSYDPGAKAYHFQSWAMGQAGDFKFTPQDHGYVWEIPAGPMTIRYTATVKDGAWHEVGDRIVADKPPVRFFEMTLRRVSDSDWPAAGAIPAK